jgi:hypothetical protein
MDNTEAGGPTFQNNIVTVYDNLGDDASVAHTLNGVATPTGVTFCGVAYTSFFIGSNGVVSFGIGVNDFSPSTAEHFSGYQVGPTVTANPGIAMAWGDLARGGVLDDVTVIESPSTNTVRVEYNNQEHWGSVLPAGSWSGTFDNANPGWFTIDMTGFIGGDPSIDQGPLVGVTDGDDTVGTDYISDLDVDIAAGYTTTVGPESIVEDFQPLLIAAGVIGSSLDVTVINFLDLGGCTYTLF